jgi:hypothetical protein
MSNISTEKKLHLPHRKLNVGKKSTAPKLAKVLPINPFANWIMPPAPKSYLKAKDRDCL